MTHTTSPSSTTGRPITVPLITARAQGKHRMQLIGPAGVLSGAKSERERGESNSKWSVLSRNQMEHDARQPDIKREDCTTNSTERNAMEKAAGARQPSRKLTLSRLQMACRQVDSKGYMNPCLNETCKKLVSSQTADLSIARTQLTCPSLIPI